MKTFSTRQGVVTLCVINGEKIFVLPMGMNGVEFSKFKDSIEDDESDEGDTSKPE